MNQSDNILTELQALSPAIARIPRLNVFKVPDGYFETISAHVLLNIYKHEGQSTLSAATAPEGYFDTLADNIMARIKKEAVTDVSIETEEISALVAGIGNANVMQVPPGYFENLGNQIISSINAPAKLINMKSRFSAFRYAAAAVVTGLIAISAFFIFNNKNTSVTSAAETAAVMSEASEILNNNSFEETLASLSDNDIVTFLESKGQNVDAALVASMSNEKNLPNAEDYLFSDNTLDEVLKNLDLNN